MGRDSVSVLIDHGDQLEALRAFKDISGFAPGVFVKIDTGYHRAGIQPSNHSLSQLYTSILRLTNEDLCFFHGFYSHAGHSYHGSDPEEAMTYLIEEITGLKKAVECLQQLYPWFKGSSISQLTLSVGATPSATSIQNLTTTHMEPTASNLRTAIHDISKLPYPCTIELHAGVYTFLDMQQISTKAAPASTPFFTSEHQMGTKHVALTILAEVASVYSDRAPPEVLVAAGTLALGREPAGNFSGWAVASDWGLIKADGKVGLGDMESSWEVWKISQEHGFLRRKSETASPQSSAAAKETDGDLPWKIGQKVRLWPNHACIAGAMFGSYVVVDKEVDEGQTVVDVWMRCRGW